MSSPGQGAIDPSSIQSPVNAPRLLLVTACTALIAFTGCRSHTTTPEGGTPIASRAAPTAAPVDPATAGSITGTIHFKGTPPARIPIDMSMDPACSLAGENLSEPFVVTKGALANVFVYIKSGLAVSAAPRGVTSLRVDQHGCRFEPHIIALQEGGSVEFTNSDPTMHNVHMVSVGSNPGMDVSQGPGAQPQLRRFDGPEVMLPIRCNNHPWMNAFLNVAPNPYFAVSGTNGSFAIKNLPPGTYTLAAVHEKLGEQDVQVTVPAHGTATANLLFAMQ